MKFLMGMLKMKSVFVVVGVLYICIGFSQTVVFSVEKLPFCTVGNDEFAPMYYRNGLVFCSNSLSATSIKSEDGKLFNILYVQKKDSSNWKNTELFSKELTTILNEGPVTYKPDAKTIFYARNSKVEGKFKDINAASNTMGIFSAELIDGIWKNIQAFPYNSDSYSLGTPALSPNGLQIFFASDMPGGYGGTDIYYSDFFSGNWQKPINLGSAINTKDNESYPYVNQAGQLFFSSDGLPGMGGKDIFYSAKLNGVWLAPIHLGANINSEYDDYGLITDINFEYGFFSSNRKSSEDIYSFNSELPQFGYCDTIIPRLQCFEFYDDRFTDSLHLNYKWNFGKGIIKYGYQIEQCFEEPGDYEVVLTIKHNLADSVFNTKAIHRFTIENVNSIFISSESASLRNEVIHFDSFIKDFEEFDVKQTYWDFGSGFLQLGAGAKHTFVNNGVVLASFALSGEKDKYGRVPRKCFSKPILIVNDYQELATWYKKQIPVEMQNESILDFDTEFPSDKNGQESFRIEFSILSNQIPLLEIDNIEQSLKEISNKYLQTLNGNLNNVAIEMLDGLLEVFSKYPKEKLMVAVHKGNKGNSKLNKQSTDIIANNIEQFFINRGLASENIQCIGYGDKRPLVNNKKKYSRYMNQRIEFIVYSVQKED